MLTLGGKRQRRLFAEYGGDLRAVHAEAVALTRASAVDALAQLEAGSTV